MEFTGERIIPGSVDDDLLNEHLCRYRFARLLVEDKVVLDVGSGVGYGSKILAEKAGSVLALDISEEAVRYAGERYAGENIELLVGDCRELPLASHSMDVVVSFELIEHLQGQKAHLLEVSRVLKPDGLTVISTPNRIFYSQESNQANPFHTHEFDFQEFLDFLKSVFSSVQIYFQNHIAGLIVGNPGLHQAVTTCLEEEPGDLGTTSNFFVAVCAHGPDYQPASGNFCLLPGTGNLLRERQQNIQRLEEEVARLDRALTRLQGEYEERTGWAQRLNRRVKSRDQALMRLRAEFEDRSRWAEGLSHELEDRTRWAKELSQQLEEKDKAIAKLQSEFEDRTEWAEDLSQQLEEKDKSMVKLRSEFEDRTEWAEDLSQQLEEKDKSMVKLQSEFEDRTEWAVRLDAELQQARSKLEAIRQSKLYRLARLLGLQVKV